MTDTLGRLGAALADRYRIERELGQGGMATVYLAHDLRHDRRVAVKVLRPELAAVIGAERFLLEIKTTANLQHPHILPLHDSGEVNGTVFYVMPYVEGESLRDRLTREKQLPVDEAIRITREVASALNYAHRHGVLHRDIKPENILLHDGQALVADFGIALAASSAGGSRMTETGMSLGTPHYMSPEQAMGERALDARSDVYALGCVLYEMLAGEPPFTGPTAQAIVARVMTETPRSIRLQRRTVAEHVEAAVLRALEKLPADRFATAAEFAEALARPGLTSLQATAFTATVAAPAPALPRRMRLLRAFPWALAAGLAVLAAWGLLRKPASAPHPMIRYSISPPAEIRIMEVGGAPVTISPNGATLVYVGRGTAGRARQLYLWRLDGTAPEGMPGTENAQHPFFSPDGEWVGFLAGGQLRRVPIRGGGAATIGAAGLSSGSFRGATWTSKGEVVFATSTGLSRMPADGGTARPVAISNGQEVVAFNPDALPDGESVVVSLLADQGGAAPELAVISLASGAVTRLGPAGVSPRYVEPGILTFTNGEGVLLAARFSTRRRRLLGPPRVVAEGISIGIGAAAKLGVSRNGTIAYLEGAALERRQLQRVDRRGQARPLEAPPRNYNGPRFSPDGRRIAVAIGAVPNPPMDIWVYNLSVGTLSRVTFDSTSAHPEWSADGRRIYNRQAARGFKAMATTLDGSAPPESLYSTNVDLWEVLPTRSGDTLITRELRTIADERDLMLVPLRPPGPTVPWAAGSRIQAEPAFSPDGRWLAYSSEESGSFEVYVRAFPGPGPRYQVSAGGGLAPRWNPRGGELFYLAGDSLLSIPVEARGNALEVGRGRPLFANRFAPLNYHAPYDVAPDGSWFVFVGASDTPLSAGLRVVLNWFDQPWKP